MLGQRLGGGDAVHDRHAHVQADDVGARLLRDGDRLATVPGLADHLDPVGLREQARDAAPDDRVVVDEQDPDHCHVYPGTARGTVPASEATGICCNNANATIVKVIVVAGYLFRSSRLSDTMRRVESEPPPTIAMDRPSGDTS